MHPINIRLTSALSAFALTAIAAAGCGERADAPGAESPITLRLATPDRQGLPGAKAIEHFRDEVARLSSGAVRIQPVFEAAGSAARFDQVVADRVREGNVEMALIPARAWDEYGVRSLAALQAPFLIRDQAVLSDVVGGELAQPMLAGLSGAGVTGLALLPEGLRHPFAFSGALRTPQDFAGATIRVPRSRSSYALFRALGARPVALNGSDFKSAATDGRLAGAESAFDIATSTLPGVPTATSNVTFFAKVNVLVANAKALAALPATARDVLDEAATRTRDWVRRTVTNERQAASRYCRQGGRVVAADPATVQELTALAQPLYAELERDATTRDLIARIRAAADGTTTAAAVVCAPKRNVSPPAAKTTDPHALDGTYRNEKTVQDYVQAGVAEAEARDNEGVHTITLNGGRLHDAMTSATDPGGQPCDGTYRLSGHTITFAWDPGTPCTGDFTARWHRSGDHLRFSDIRTDELLDQVYWGVKPFRKIG